jgi:dTDP-4-amino-4,6-dideoxygalactose transaminase
VCIFKPISISLSPNTEKDDIRLALKLIFRPWLWKGGKAVLELEDEFKKYLGIKYAFSFNGGRTGLLAILTALGLKPGNEVLVQAFTCNAAVNPIIWAGFEPIYVDCNEDDFNIDIDDLKNKISSRSKVVMVQHTFGLPADMDKILEICNQNNLILIEDCAHALGAEYSPPHQTRADTGDIKNGITQPLLWCGGKGRKVGTFGKAAFFSFSRDKVISSVYGGMVVTNDPELGEKLRQAKDKLAYPSYCWIFQQLLHPVLMNYLILPLYGFFGLGKFILLLCQWLKILSKAVHWKEKRGLKPSYFLKKMPNALAELALNQFNKLEKFNEHRKKIAEFYFENLKNFGFELPKSFPERKNMFLRFTIKHPGAHQIIKKAWQKNILIGDWYTSPVAPWDTKLDKLKYKPGSCPKAEKLSKKTLNLPTHINISEKETRKIIDFLLG